jgi:hypothetical protein
MNQEDLENYQMQEALQRNQLDTQTAINSPQMFEQMSQNQAIMVQETNPRKIVEEIMLRLRGIEKKSDGTLVKVTEPKMNEYGLGRIWFVLQSHINQNVILSHLVIEEIRPLMTALSEDLVDSLALNWKDFGIKNKTDLDDINNAILINIYLALKRAEGQNEKNWLGKISIENISGGSNLPKMKKEGFWDKFKL